MLLNGDDDTKIRRLIEMFHEKEVVDTLYTHIEKGTNVLDKFVLHCDEENCDSCILGACCKQKNIQYLINVVHQGAKGLSFDKFVDDISKYKNA